MLTAIRRNAEKIHDQLEPIALEIIADIEEAAGAGLASIEQLIREKRVHDAELRAALPENESRLNALYSLRDSGVWQVNTLTNAEGIDCSRFKKPLSMTSDVELSSDKTPAARWHSRFSRGGRLHYYTPKQWLAVADEHAQSLRKKTAQQHQEFVDFNRADISVWCSTRCSRGRPLTARMATPIAIAARQPSRPDAAPTLI